MAKPYAFYHKSGAIWRYGEYYGSDTKNYSSFILYRNTKPFPWMTYRNGGWRWYKVNILRHTLKSVSPAINVNESDAYANVTLKPSRCSSATTYPGYNQYPSTNNVINCVRNKVKNASINLPVFAAEAQKSANMIGDTAKRLAHAALAITHGNFGRAAGVLGLSGTPKNLQKHQRGLRSLESNWLAYQYGWIPLLSDVSNAVDALTRPAKDGTLGIARCRKPFELSERFQAKGMTLNMSTSGYVGAGVYYLCKNSTDFTSLGLTNPLELAWELIPYSFVVDWFIPIGKAISALDAFTNVTVLASYNIVRYTEDIKAVYDVTRSDNYYRWSGEVEGQRNGMIRNVSVTGGSAVTTQIPRVQFALNPQKLLSGIALLHGAFGRRVK